MLGVRLTVDSNVNRLRKDNGRFLAGIPDIEEDTTKEFADNLEENVRDSIDQKFDRLDGDLKDSVNAQPSKSSGDGVKYEVTANAYSSEGVNYAAWHEYATSGHTAPVEGDLKRWARKKGILDDIGTGLHVTPMNQEEGSFIQPAVQKTISKQRRKMRSGRNEVNQGLSENFN